MRTRQLLESRVAARRLGRHVQFDERSRRFPATSLVPKGAKLTSKLWARAAPALDQGDVGSCTGEGAAGLLLTAPFSKARVSQQTALAIYSRATRMDPFPGSYPAEDTGSTVLAAMRATVKMGLAKGYRWCFGLQDVLKVLSNVGPVEVGVNWYEGFDDVVDGRVQVAGEVRGGHAFELLGINTTTRTVTAINSWGSEWGDGGRFTFSWDDLDRLLHEEGEASTLVK